MARRISVTVGSTIDLRDYAVTDPSEGGGLGILKPSAETCGTFPLADVPRSTVSGNVTLTSANSPYTNRTVTGRITIAAGHHVVIRNVQSRDIQCEAAGASCEVYDSSFLGSLPSISADGGAVVGHDIYMERCILSGHIDGFVIRNTQAGVTVYQSGVTIKHCWVKDLVYWTGPVGTVHNQDTWSHNDGMQHMGGWGTQVIGSWFNANWKHQEGHWRTVGASEVEPYNGIAVGSLGGSPALPLWRIPDRGDGNNANGRYNSDSLSDGTKSISLTCILIGNNVGTSRDLHFVNNWFWGGDLCFNGGGFARGSETNFLVEVAGNRVDRSQGNQSANPITGGFGSGWVGSPYVDIHDNVREDNGAPV